MINLHWPEGSSNILHHRKEQIACLHIHPDVPIGLILILVLPEDNFVQADLWPAQQCIPQGLSTKSAPLKLLPEAQHSRSELFPQIYEILKISSNKTFTHTTTRFMDAIKTAALPASFSLSESVSCHLGILFTAASNAVLSISMINTRRTCTISKLRTNSETGNCIATGKK